MAKKIKARIGDRWGIIGATGSGKTHLTKFLLHQLARGTKGQVPIYVLDSKISRDGGDFKEFFSNKSMGRVFKGNQIPPLHNPLEDGYTFCVIQPEEDDIEFYDEFFKQVYQKRMPAVVYIDELSSITNAKGTVFPRYYDILLKQGRGLDIGLISTTQSPSFVPPNLIRQVTHLVRMRLNDTYDAKKLSSQLGKITAETEPNDPFGFFYRDCTKPKKSNPVVYYKDAQEFFNISD